LRRPLSFSELFALWHGRSPEDSEWPVPRQVGGQGSYEWQAPELTLLATLVGRLSTDEIADALTTRLQNVTGDDKAVRSRVAVLLACRRVGLQARDVVGGVTTKHASEEIGSLAMVQNAIAKKALPTFRVGRRLVIPHGAWASWKAKRKSPPPGYVPLASLKEPLSIKSDKLSEFARLGYIPTAVRCNPYGTKGPSTQFGTWFIEQAAGVKLVADRRAGLPMPWHGKPMLDNLRVTYKLWFTRKHPAACQTCKTIWGPAGAPKDFDGYILRYCPLAHGAKRHLTMPWGPGLTVEEVASRAGCSVAHVRVAIKAGTLEAVANGRYRYVSKTDAAKWIARRCPVGSSVKSWVSLDTAVKVYGFTLKELRGYIKAGQLISKIGSAGGMNGVEYVAKQQCGRLRDKIGFTEKEAARRAGVGVVRFRELLDGVHWRGSSGIPLFTVQAVIKRLQSRPGYTIEEAASVLKKPVKWVEARRDDGTIKMATSRFDSSYVYISEPMLRRLKEAKKVVKLSQPKLGPDWLKLSEAAFEAGVSNTTLMKWADDQQVRRKFVAGRAIYGRESVRARARKYWAAVRFHRAKPPQWLIEERTAAIAA
jgi:excisionase family DNA binding protein